MDQHEKQYIEATFKRIIGDPELKKDKKAFLNKENLFYPKGLAFMALGQTIILSPVAYKMIGKEEKSKDALLLKMAESTAEKVHTALRQYQSENNPDSSKFQGIELQLKSNVGNWLIDSIKTSLSLHNKAYRESLGKIFTDHLEYLKTAKPLSLSNDTIERIEYLADKVSSALRNDPHIADQITKIERKEAERAARKGPERVIKSVLIGSALVINPLEKKFSKEPQKERKMELSAVASSKLYEAIQKEALDIKGVERDALLAKLSRSLLETWTVNMVSNKGVMKRKVELLDAISLDLASKFKKDTTRLGIAEGPTAAQKRLESLGRADTVNAQGM
jgi:hypothetical protein